MRLIPVLFADTAIWGTSYMRGRIAARDEDYTDGVTVRTQKPSATNADPAPASGRVVTIRDDGGPRNDDVTKTVTLGVNVWADDEGECADLALMCAAILEDSVGSGPVVAHAGTFGPYPVSDSSGKPHRYLSVDLMVAGVPL